MEADEDFPMTGKAKLSVTNALQLFQDEQEHDVNLRKMRIEQDPTDLPHCQIKRVVIKGRLWPYQGKLINILVYFSDEYPRRPPKLFM